MPRIEQLYAFVVADKDEDDEGVPAFLGPTGTWLPMMGADEEMMDLLRDRAHFTAEAMGKPIKLIRSTGIEIVETINP